MNNKSKALVLITGLLAFFSITSTVYAHGFGERYDLPIPLLFFIVAAIIAVGLSFVLVGVFVTNFATGSKYLKVEIGSKRWFRYTVGLPFFQWLIKSFCVFVLLLLFATALFGSNKPIENFSPTFIWVIWWVGLGFISAVFGNIWAFINPWKIVFEFAEKIFGKPHGFKPLQRYPLWLKSWPSVILFLIFAWIENVYWGSAVPRNLAVLLIIYSLVQWVGMLWFGKHVWLRNGDPFSTIFGFFSQFSMTETRVFNSAICEACEQECLLQNQSNCIDCHSCFSRSTDIDRNFFVRPPSVGFFNFKKTSASTMIFVLILLATVTFDGIKETPFWNEVHLSLTNLSSVQIDSLGLIILPLLFFGIYLLFCFGIRYFSTENMTLVYVAQSFVLSLLPIALAYHFAHYLSVLLIPGQAVVPLLSDPFGMGWNIFGTASYKINLNAINAKAAWFFSVAVIILGHVLAVYMSHLVSLKILKSRDNATRSQYPMLILMLLYTAISLWILSMPIVE